MTIATIPGARLFHEGQFEGRKIRLPVFLGRRPAEPVDPDLQAFYHTLLKADFLEGLREGELAALRAHRLAGQCQFPEPRCLVLAQRRGAPSDRRESLELGCPGDGTAALGGTARQPMAGDRPLYRTSV